MFNKFIVLDLLIVHDSFQCEYEVIQSDVTYFLLLAQPRSQCDPYKGCGVHTQQEDIRYVETFRPNISIS